MLPIIGGVIAVFVIVVAILAAMKPARSRIQRSITVQAPPERIYPLIADFRSWRSWSPWEGIDPGMKRTYSGADAGKGAVYGWDGNKQAGAGRMEITEAAAPRHVTIALDFTRPWEAHNTTEFDLAPAADATEVTWAMHGPQPMMMRVMTVFMSLERMVGKDFEKGLAALKAQVEGRGAPAPGQAPR